MDKLVDSVTRSFVHAINQSEEDCPATAALVVIVGFVWASANVLSVARYRDFRRN